MPYRFAIICSMLLGFALILNVYVQHVDKPFEPKRLPILLADTKVTIGDGVEANHLPITECSHNYFLSTINCTIHIRTGEKCKFSLNNGNPQVNAYVLKVHQLSEKKLIIISRVIESPSMSAASSSYNAIIGVDAKTCTSTAVLKFPESDDLPYDLWAKVVIYPRGFDVIFGNSITGYDANARQIGVPKSFLVKGYRGNVCPASRLMRFGDFIVKTENTVNLVNGRGQKIKVLVKWREKMQYVFSCDESSYTICLGNDTENSSTIAVCRVFDQFGREQYSDQILFRGLHAFSAVKNLRAGGVVVFTFTNEWDRFHVTKKKPGRRAITSSFHLKRQVYYGDTAWLSYYPHLTDFNEKEGTFILAYRTLINKSEHFVELRKYKIPIHRKNWIASMFL